MVKVLNTFNTGFSAVVALVAVSSLVGCSVAIKNKMLKIQSEFIKNATFTYLMLCFRLPLKL